MIWFIVFVAVVLVIVVARNRGSRRRAHDVDYYKREYRDPQIPGRWINGGWG